MSMIDDGFDLIFLFVVDQVRQRLSEVGSMRGGFFIGQEQGGVEYVVNSPRQGKSELVRHRRYDLVDVERTLASGC